MEEKKLMHKNQVLERDFQISDGIAENVNHTQKVYGRDLLLQLRLHPLSLQKPKHLPGMTVIKERLYLHDITNSSSTSNDKQVDSNNYHATLKSDCFSMKHDYQTLPHYVNRMYPYYFAPHVNDGAYSGSSRYRSSLHTYCSPLKKHSVTGHCYKDFPVDEYNWAKRCFATSEDMWNCYQNFSKKKEHIEAVPKRKLPIIDPETGRNILETVTSAHQKEQKAENTVPGHSESSDSVPVSGRAGEKYSGDYFFNNEVNNDSTFHLTNDACTKAMPSSENKMCHKLKSSKDMGEVDYYCKGSDNNLTNEDTVFDCKSAPTSSNKDETVLIDTKAKTVYTYEDIQVIQMKLANELQQNNMHTNWDPPMPLGKNANKTDLNKENNHSEVGDSVQAHQQNFSEKNETMKESLQHLKDKICTLRQEQQKMNILQSFLRYKKYQLEETARNLDEKRIEIANWECNLYNKAKKLHDKELWLESKSEILYNKALQLAEKEDLLSKENKSSADGASLKVMSKDSDFSANKPVFDNSADATWDEISKKVKSSYRNGKSSDYSYFGYSSMNKVGGDSSPSIEQCKSDACSLDELEKNIVLIEKMHSSTEGDDGTVEKKRDLSPSSTMQKKGENDSLGHSKGRRYLPEHIKYWLNKRDKNAL